MFKINIFKSFDHLSLFIAVLSLCGALVYRLSNLSAINAYLTFIFSLLLYFTLLHIINKVKLNKQEATNIPDNEIREQPKKILIKILYFLYFVFIFLGFLILLRSASTDSIISPWQKIPGFFFIIIFFSTLIFGLLAISTTKLKLFPIIIFSFLINSVAIIVYKYGFGFDFFIHESTMELIDQAGKVDPKQLYYLGQYSLIIIIHKIFNISIFYLHLLLVPVLSSILIPLALNRFLDFKSLSSYTKSFTILFVMIAPLGIFFNTTPQNLAFLFLFLVIIRSLTCRDYFDLSYIYLFSFAAIFIQPVAGIPALILAIAINIYHSDLKKIKNYLLYILYISASLILPLAFIILNRLNNLNAQDTTNKNTALNNFFDVFRFKFPDNENIILNTIYFFNQNKYFFIAIIILFGAYITIIKYKKNNVYTIIVHLAMAFLLSFFLMSFISFDFLIDYERSDYAQRILFVSLLFSFPFIIEAIVLFLEKLKQKNKTIKVIFYLAFCLIVPILIYLNYPRLDNYHNSHGYSVGQADLDAVHWIENDSPDNYIVLANQQTSVAALREFGFNKYYKNPDGQDIFYYPIPTGGPLYPFFLKMVNDKPSKETILKAMDLVNVDTGYFVISKFWWASSRIIEEAKLEANFWQSINNGEIYVFKYSR